MPGSATVRTCPKCFLQVYDLSSLSETEAEGLLRKKEGKENLVLYKRRDGRFLSKDCPVGVTVVASAVLLIAVSIYAATGYLLLSTLRSGGIRTSLANKTTQSLSPGVQFLPPETKWVTIHEAPKAAKAVKAVKAVKSPESVPEPDLTKLFNEEPGN